LITLVKFFLLYLAQFPNVRPFTATVTHYNEPSRQYSQATVQFISHYDVSLMGRAGRSRDSRCPHVVGRSLGRPRSRGYVGVVWPELSKQKHMSVD